MIERIVAVALVPWYVATVATWAAIVVPAYLWDQQ